MLPQKIKLVLNRADLNVLFDYSYLLLSKQAENIDIKEKQNLIQLFYFSKMLYEKKFFAPEKIKLNIKIEQALAFQELYVKYGIKINPEQIDNFGMDYYNHYKIVIRQTISTINQKTA